MLNAQILHCQDMFTQKTLITSAFLAVKQTILMEKKISNRAWIIKGINGPLSNGESSLQQKKHICGNAYQLNIRINMDIEALTLSRLVC